jgi:phosphate-selective porin OprO/OprP
MSRHRAALAVLLLAVPSCAMADEADRVAALEQQLRAAQEQLRQLKAHTPDSQAALADIKRSSDAQHADLKARLTKEPSLRLDHGRLSFVSANGDFSLALRSTVQFDAGYFAQGRNPPSVDLNSGTNFRRAQFGFAGTAFRDWSYNFTYDFGGTGAEQRGYLYRAYVEYDGFRPFGIRVGAFAPPANVEDATGGANLLFLERPAAATIARGIAGGSSRQGVDLFAQGERYLVSIAYTGGKSVDPVSFDEQQGLVGRASYLVIDTPGWKWLLDADASHVFRLPDMAAGHPPASISLGTGPELAIDASRTVDTGPLSAKSVSEIGLETAGVIGRVYGEAGWFGYRTQRGPLPDPSFSGWYVESAFSLTGEPRPYDPVTASFHSPEPAHPLGTSGGFGAFESVARFSRVDLDWRPGLAASAGGVTGGVQDIWTLGLNWYPNTVLKFMLDYDNITVRHAEARGRDISAGAVALRSQIAF